MFSLDMILSFSYFFEWQLSVVFISYFKKVKNLKYYIIDYLKIYFFSKNVVICNDFRPYKNIFKTSLLFEECSTLDEPPGIIYSTWE